MTLAQIENRIEQSYVEKVVLILGRLYRKFPIGLVDQQFSEIQKLALSESDDTSEIEKTLAEVGKKPLASRF